LPPTLLARLRRAGQGLALLALLSPFWSAASAEELEGAGALGVDLSFAPFFGRAPAGTILQRVRHPTSDQIRWASTEGSVERTADLGARWRLIRLDRFGRKADYELSAALRGADALVLDLRHNRGGVLRRMLRIAARFTGPVPDALRLVKADQVRLLAIPQPSGAVWRGGITVLVGANTISSGEVLAALLRRHADATVLGERTWGKNYVLRVEPVDPDWRALIPDARIEVPGEILAGGLIPDGPIPAALLARVGDGVEFDRP
jgi:C-terminal processing protease CtpA/Prc